MASDLTEGRWTDGSDASAGHSLHSDLLCKEPEEMMSPTKKTLEVYRNVGLYRLLYS